MSAPLRVAVVGSGPAGFYAAAPLLAAGAEVDVIERLPTPWGLVRLGVAPDHPQLKTVSRAFEKIAAQPGFRFLGNVEVGRDIEHEELAGLYDAVIYSYGSAADRRLGIPGEDLRGSWAATELVAWYNGHPDFQQLEFDLASAERVVVVGNGNVALDVARMLALTRDEIGPDRRHRRSDRGHRRLGDPRDRGARTARPGPGVRGRRRSSTRWATSPARTSSSTRPSSSSIRRARPSWTRPRTSSSATWRSCASSQPASLQASRGASCSASASRRSRCSGKSAWKASSSSATSSSRTGSGSVRAQATDERETLSCELVFRSVGYRGLPCPGVPFDEARGTMPNAGGRVLGEDGQPLRGVYCAGWIKRGPTGVIGTNKKDAAETVEALLADAEAGVIGGRAAPAEAVDALLAERGIDAVVYAGWEAIDAAEQAAGEPQGRPRDQAHELGRPARRRPARRNNRAACGCIGTQLAQLSARHWDMARLAAWP